MAGADAHRGTEVVGDHPALDGVSESDADHVRMVAFAQDLAAWLNGVPPEELGALVRVVTTVARELRSTRHLCRRRPALAIEAAAHATASLWPAIREQPWALPDEPLEDEVPPDEEEDDDAEETRDREEPDPDEDDGDLDIELAESPDADPEEEGDDGKGEEEDDGEGDGDEEDEDGEDHEGEAEDEADDDEGEANPETGQPETDESEDGEPDTGEPEDGQPEAGEPDTGQPEDGEPDTAQPDTGQPDTGQPETGDPDTGEPDTGPSSSSPPPSPDLPLDPSLNSALQEAASTADQAALDASRALDHLSRFFPGSGWSLSPGAVHALAASKLESFVRLVERLPELDLIAEQLGRLDAAEREGGDDLGGGEEVTGVTLSGEVAHALPSELGLLADPDTEDLFYARQAERRLVSLELSGAGLDGAGRGDQRGPIIACLDASASMDGAPELTSKALVLALARRVVPQGRAVHVLMFGGRDQHLEIRLDRRPRALLELLDLLTRSYDGGTDFDTPLLRALDLLEERELAKADILVVTDGKAVTDRHVEHRVDEVRRALGLRVTTVVIGGTWLDGVKGFSDEVWTLQPGRVDGAVGLVRSLGGR